MPVILTDVGERGPEIAVIGGGLIGCAIAWQLRSRGLTTVVFDAGNMPGKASTAAAGMLAPGGEFRTESPWTRMALQSLRMYPDFIARVTEESGIAVDYGVCGAVERPRDAGHWDELQARAASQRRMGMRVELGSRELLYPDDAYVDPPELLSALRRIAGPIRSEPVAERFACEQYAAVVVAAGAWSSGLDLRFRGQRVPLSRCFPVKGHLLGFELAPKSIPAIVRQEHTYVVQRASGFTVAGSTEEESGFDTAVDEEICRGIHARAAVLVPDLVRAVPSRQWIGFRPKTESGQPALGPVAGTNIHLAYGHYRNGVLLAPATAAQISAEISATLGTD